MKNKVVFDGRNIYDKELFEKLGFLNIMGLGRNRIVR